jgi:Cu-Zn family superoxide dismutase
MSDRRIRWAVAMLVCIALGAVAMAFAGTAAPSAASGAMGTTGTTGMMGSTGTMPMTAKATLESASDPKLTGTVTITQGPDAVRLVVDVTGVSKPGPHGLHLHENGMCDHDPAGKNYTTAGGHFNPTAVAHACPDSSTHHAGDFGNIDIKPDGTGHLELITSMLSLHGSATPVGKAIILHEGSDDCKTQPTGNSGGRLACGVVKSDSMSH